MADKKNKKHDESFDLDENDKDLKPINFDDDEENGPSDFLNQPFISEEDARGDSEDDQYYDEEEALSPEEAKKRKQGDDL